MARRDRTGSMRILGCMSGTSLDGVDAAVLVTDGEEVEAMGESAFRPYGEAERAVLRAALGRWPAEPGVEEAARVVEAAHAEVIAGFAGLDAVAFHGQTLAHDPGAGRTHQAGNGARLAEAAGQRVVWDFRSNDMALGGQGAPLAPFYHFALARRIGARTAFLNLGGVGNLSFCDPAFGRPEDPGAVLAFDTGPANAPMDDLCRARGLGERDEGGALALAGRADEGVLARMKSSSYLAASAPKSLDRNDFDWLHEEVAALSDSDALATLAACAVAGVVAGMALAPSPPERLLVTGGGRHNAALMEGLRAALPIPVEPVEAAGLDGDMLEAQAFAFLAARVLRGLPTSAPGTTGVAAAVGGGQVSGARSGPRAA